MLIFGSLKYGFEKILSLQFFIAEKLSPPAGTGGTRVE